MKYNQTSFKGSVFPVLSSFYDHWMSTLPTGSTVVPIIGLSDQTHPTNSLADKKAWPVYMMIGNILSGTRNSPVKMPVLLRSLLPVPPKLTGESTHIDEAQQ